MTTPEPPWAAALDRARDPLGVRSACFAPLTSLYLDTRGDVLACCHSHVTPLGNVGDSSLKDIWWGEAAAAMRRQLADFALPPACRHCAWQLADGNVAEAYLTNFDRFQPDEALLGWPAQIEFSMSNRCNLQCVMCSGDFSSTIRSRREGRAPLPMPYGEAFFEQLPPFLRHLRQARFLGGEPFLVPEYERIWDLLIAQDRRVDCDVTTNGTVWTPRVEAVLDALPFSIAVSLDGATRSTVEAIRVGADFDAVMANVGRFADHCARHGTPFALTYCLMVPNWHEFPAFLTLAEDLGADVFVNTVTWPPHLSLYELGHDELLAVVDGLEELHVGGSQNHAAIGREAARLRRWLDRRGTGPGDAHFERWSPVPTRFATGPSAPRLDLAAAVDGLAATAVGGVAVVHTDADDLVTAVEGGDVLGVAATDLLGRSFGSAMRTLADRLGHLVLVADDEQFADGVARSLLFDRDGRRTRMRAATLVERDTTGRVSSATTALATVEAFVPGPRTTSGLSPSS